MIRRGLYCKLTAILYVNRGNKLRKGNTMYVDRKSLVATCYAGSREVDIRPHKNVSVIVTHTKGCDNILVECGKLSFEFTIYTWSRETDHWHETDYINMEVLVKFGDKQLVKSDCAEFNLRLINDTFFLGLRRPASHRVSDVGSATGNKTEVHMVNTNGLYGKLASKACDVCTQEDGMARAMYGCMKCIIEHMKSFENQAAEKA